MMIGERIRHLVCVYISRDISMRRCVGQTGSACKVLVLLSCSSSSQHRPHALRVLVVQCQQCSATPPLIAVRPNEAEHQTLESQQLLRVLPALRP